jgi:hypothetical protein
VISLPWLAAAQPKAQDQNAHGWFNYFGDHELKGRWGLHLEGQYRRHNVATRWQQLLLRPALNYEVSKSLTLSAGYGFVDTHRYGSYPVAAKFNEHRVYQQASVRQTLGRVGLQHRYRLEQRWVGANDGNGGSRRYQNRFRYMARATIRLRNSEKYYLSVYDEVFLGFAPNYGANSFDQNRAFAALGIRLNPTTSVELGYMQQTVAQRSGRVTEYNHTLAVALVSTRPFGRKH